MLLQCLLAAFTLFRCNLEQLHNRSHLLLLNNFTPFLYYDHQLSKTRRKFDDQVLTFNLCCCNRQLAPFPVATCRSLTALAARRAKLQAAILLPLETRKVARGNSVILSLKHFHQSSSRLTQLIIVVYLKVIVYL